MRKYMEENLDIPVSGVLEIIQKRIMEETTYFGIQTLKNPLDFWIYREIIYETSPDVIIEIGNYKGGSALALAHICDVLKKGRVIALDISHSLVHEIARDHSRITFIEGDACRSFDKVKKIISSQDKILIIEDSSHTYENTLNVLNTYSTLIKPGQYFVVEDGICHHGLETGPNPGPYEAINDFIKNNHEFEVDRSKESFFITWNPMGFLRRRL